MAIGPYLRGGWSAALCVALVTGATAAQRGRIELTPFAGGLIPTSVLGMLQVPGNSSEPITVEGKLKLAGAFGARLGIWVNERWGLEAGFAHSSSDLTIALGNLRGEIDGQVEAGSLKTFYRVTKEGTETDFLISAGVGAVHHGGPGFRLASAQLDPAGVAGAGLHLAMSSYATLRFDGELFLYRWSPGSSGGSTFQSDLVVSAGLAISLNR